MNDKGKVYLVGAGPGDPELITLKARKLLDECDAVVYDRLIPMELIVTLAAKVQRHFVGKAADCHSLPQEKINELLVELAQRGLKVIRLKGGDPFVFGRGGEEALYLKKRGIPFEVVPGITAGIAASAYAGIPVTHRNKSAFTVLLTAHETTKDETQIPWDWLGKVKDGSIVGYMGVKQLPEVVEKLISGGMDPQTPAALIERGTTGVQKSVMGKLSDLYALATDAHISPPALFVIGETVNLAPDIQWFGGGILSGKRVLVTRPADQAQEMYKELRSYGAEVLPLPTIATRSSQDTEGWNKLDLWAGNPDRSEENNWIVFTSENGVRYFISQLFERNYDHRFLGRFKIAAMGIGTDRALRKHHLQADFLPSKFTSVTLAQEFSDHMRDHGCYIVRVRGNLGDDTIERSLEKIGAEVLPLQVYNTFTAEWDAGMWAFLADNPPDIITFTSGSTVTGFSELLADKAEKIIKDAVIASIGPMTSEILTQAGMKVSIQAQTHSVPGLVEAVVKHFQ